MSPPSPPGRKSAAWWDDFWRRPPPSRNRALTARRTAEEALGLLARETGRSTSRAIGSSVGDTRPAGRLRVLDLGCGNGDLTIRLLDDPRLEVVALDLSDAALARFRQALGSNRPDRLRLVRASVYELPFADGTFDAVTSFGYASAASYSGAEWEVGRVLRPGGVAIVDFANPSLYHWLANPRGTRTWYRRFRDPGQAQYHFGRRGLAAHFGPAGLRLERVRYVNAYPPVGLFERLAGAAWPDRLLSSSLGPLLGRVMLAALRRAHPPR